MEGSAPIIKLLLVLAISFQSFDFSTLLTVHLFYLKHTWFHQLGSKGWSSLSVILFFFPPRIKNELLATLEELSCFIFQLTLQRSHLAYSHGIVLSYQTTNKFLGQVGGTMSQSFSKNI